jgi:hypothetical protein
VIAGQAIKSGNHIMRITRQTGTCEMKILIVTGVESGIGRLAQITMMLRDILFHSPVGP